MDHILNKCVQLTEAGAVDDLQDFLDSQTSKLENGDPNQLTHVLEALVGDVHKFTYTITFFAGLRAAHGKDGTASVRVFEALVNQGNYRVLQGRKAILSRWKDLTRRYVEVLRESRQYRRALSFLLKASQKFKPTPEHLTPAHAGFMQIALKGENPKAALDLFETPIYSIDPAATGADARDYLSYYFYAGLVQGLYHRWAAALRCFENCFYIPATNVSAIMIAAFKAMLLVGYIANNRAPPVPRTVSYSIEKILRGYAQPYADLVSALEADDINHVSKIVAQNQNTFDEDNMQGYVNQAVDAMNKSKITSLTRVYDTLSINAVCNSVGLQQAKVEELLRTMISQKEVEAVMDTGSGTVVFGKTKRSGKQAEAVMDETELLERITRAVEMGNRIREHDHDVSTSLQYLSAKIQALPHYKEIIAAARRVKNNDYGEVLLHIEDIAEKK